MTTLPGVKTVRAAFSAFSLPLERFADAEHLYAATGLAPARYQSSTLSRRGRISRQCLAEHRDALMSIAWRLSQNCGTFRDQDLRARHGQHPGASCACPTRLPAVFCIAAQQQPFDEQRYRQARHQRER